MARTQKTLPAKLFVGLRTTLPEVLEEVSEALAASFGEVDLQSPVFPVILSPEPPGEQEVSRKFLSFEVLIDPGRLPRIHRATSRVQRELGPKRSRGAPPPVRIEPGYITSANLVLASPQNAAHRVYLARGVYAEVAFIHLDGAFRHSPWTAQDLRSDTALEFFTAAHKKYLGQVQLAAP